MNQRPFLLLLFCLLALMLGLVFQNSPSIAQDLPVPTAVSNAENALATYETRCASCHGVEGMGDGELAPQTVNPPTAFGLAEYRQTAVPAEMFNTINNGRLTRGMPLFGQGSSNPLTDQEIWDLIALIYSFSTPPEMIARGSELADEQAPPENLPFWATTSNEMALDTLIEAGAISDEFSLEDQLALIDYLRTGSYDYLDLALLNAPLETAVITGSIINGSTETAVDELNVNLRGYTLDLVEVINQSATTDASGNYQFELTDVGPDWVYIVSTEYNTYDFNSAPSQIERTNPTADLSITVFDTSTDVSNIVIEQLQIIVDFVETDVQIAELYTISNLAPSLFVGSEGDPALGTVQIPLPAGASSIQFQRAFGATGNFTEATEIIHNGTGWVDTLPINPGRGTTEILVTYVLPYASGMSIGHPLPYSLGQATLLMPDNGVEARGDGWQFQGQQLVQVGMVSSYINTAVQGKEVINLELNGRPTTVRDLAGNTVLQRNDQREIVMGSAALIGAAMLIFAGFRFQNQSQPVEHSSESLLQQLAQLDTAYENQQLSPTQYQQRRQALKADLVELWRE